MPDKETIDGWKWVRCPFIIRKQSAQNKDQLTYESLQPDFQFQCEENCHKLLSISLELERKFIYEAETGFSWHKNCIIPQLTVTIDKGELQELRKHEDFETIYCEILSVYPVNQNENSFLNVVSLIGVTKKPFTNEVIRFSNLKFEETSFTHKKTKFHILIWVYAQNQSKSKNNFVSYISSQIYVDSRKEARKKVTCQTIMSNKLSMDKFVEPLFIRVNNKRKKIENSLDGFTNFYSAQNIRNKIKHPFYLGYHFSTAFKIYYNQNQCQNPMACLNQLIAAQKFSPKVLLIEIVGGLDLKKKYYPFSKTGDLPLYF